jgi:NADH:ubiquinone oxidoreductase subunit F (NADH-binding)
MLSTKPRDVEVVRVCDGPVCCLHDGEAMRAALDEAAEGRNVCVERTSCLGLCDRAPAALVGLKPCGPLSALSTDEILAGSCGKARSYADPLDGEVRVALQRIGKVDPDEIKSAIEHGAYESLKSALQSDAANVLKAVVDSGLQGRGGAGFPTGRKWQFVAQAVGSPKYIVCNADESEPAAFKDRVLMEDDPHLLLEGMALAALAVGASRGYIYIRGEYEPAARRLERAIRQAERSGWLGENIQSSNFSFTIHMHRGAGAYICGEETALLESLEGRRGEPRYRPPYPTTLGLYGKPTVVNNVETLCKIPAILAQGPQWYRSLGTSNSPGTKLFTVTGHVNRPGLFEAPFGITLQRVIEEFGGGMRNGSRFKMALTGGAAGTIVGPSALDVPLDFAAHERGVSLGSGAIFVMDESVSVPKLLRWLLHFFEVESCGKCTPCREGTLAARQIVHRLENDNARRDDIEQLARLSKMLRLTSLCGLGQSVAWPIDSALKNFPKEFQCSSARSHN